MKKILAWFRRELHCSFHSDIDYYWINLRDPHTGKLWCLAMCSYGRPSSAPLFGTQYRIEKVYWLHPKFNSIDDVPKNARCITPAGGLTHG